jgi:FkbM family methyltransferase
LRSSLGRAATSTLSGAPLLHRIAHRYVASGGRGATLLWRCILAAGRPAGSAALRIGEGGLELDLANPYAELAMYCGQFEQLETQILRRLTRRSAVCVDAGANIGFHTLLLAALTGPGGRVYAFEPSPPAVDRLKDATANLANVIVSQAALGAGDGTTTLIVAPGDSMHSTTRTIGQLPSGRRLSVPVISLDSYANEAGIEHIDVLKIDVEGGEAAVFRGAADLLERKAIGATLAEVEPEYGPVDWVRRLAGLDGYRAFTIRHAGRLSHRAVLADDVNERLSAREAFTLVLVRSGTRS